MDMFGIYVEKCASPVFVSGLILFAVIYALMALLKYKRTNKWDLLLIDLLVFIAIIAIAIGLMIPSACARVKEMHGPNKNSTAKPSENSSDQD